VCVSHRIGSPPTTLKPGGRHREGRLDFIFNAKYYCVANFYEPGSVGLRTPEEKCRPPGLKTDASALGKWLFGFSPEGGIGTAGVRKPPDREPPNTAL
jgi:hypothetical protein